jgi:hypothetical protein
VDTESSSRPTRVRVIGALAIIGVLVVIVLGMFWVQRMDEQNERARCAESGLVQNGTSTIESCMLVRGYH